MSNIIITNRIPTWYSPSTLGSNSSKKRKKSYKINVYWVNKYNTTLLRILL